MSKDLELSILRQNVISSFFEDGTAHVREYLDAGGDPNLAEPRFGTSILTMSAAEGSEELVEHLLALGADPNITDTFYGSALHAAIIREWRNMTLGLPRHIVLDSRPWVPMYQKLIAAGADVNLFANGQTPLHLAARRGLTGVARFLVEAGADLYAEDDEGKTPFGAASDVREYLAEAMQQHHRTSNIAWFDIDTVFDRVRGCINDIGTVLAQAYPEHGLIASLVCLRLIGEQFPKNLSAEFCKTQLARTKELFYNCYGLAEAQLSPHERDGLLAAAEREFLLFEQRVQN
jgi:hypothetical protein